MRCLTFLLLLFAAAGQPLHAQNSPALGAEGRVGGVIGGGVGLTTVRGTLVPVLRGELGLHLLPGLRVGGEAALPLGGVRLSTDESPARSELRLGYGGVRLDFDRSTPETRDPWRLSLLAGAGIARVRTAPLGVDLGSRNFFLIEPGLHRNLTTRGPFTLSASVGFRLVAGGEGLPGVRPRDLQGASTTVTLDFNRIP